eukprot:Selendium_serpulae@DN2416_c0_g1_i1.p1
MTDGGAKQGGEDFPNFEAMKDVDGSWDGEKGDDCLSDKLSNFGELLPPDPKLPITKVCYMLGAVSFLAGMIFGFDIGGSGGTYVMPGFEEHLGWNTMDSKQVAKQQGWIGSLFSLGAFCGALPSGWIGEFSGRKWLMFGANAVFIVGAILQVSTPPGIIAVLYVGRFISGSAVGVLSGMTGVYVGETAPTKIRGTFITCFQLAITLGIVTAGFLNVFLSKWDEGWRISYGGNMVFAIALMILLFFMPESPRWHFMKGREEECRVILAPYRSTQHEVDYEIQLMKKELEADPGQASWGEIFSSKDRQLWRTCVGCLIQFFQQWTGINAVMFFAPSMIGTFANDKAALWGNLLIQFSNFIATFITVWFVDRTGRWPLLWTGGVGMIVSLFTLVFLSAPYSPYETVTGLGVGIVLCCCTFVIFFAFSWGPLGWVICAEIHPNRTKGKAVSLSTAANWLTASVVARLTPVLYDDEVIGLWGTFLIFGCMCIIMTIFVWMFLPETLHIMPEEVVQLFEEWPTMRLKRAKWIPPSKRPFVDSEGEAKSVHTTIEEEAKGSNVVPV